MGPFFHKNLKIIFYICLGTKANIIQVGFIIIIFSFPLILKEIKMKPFLWVPKQGPRYHAACLACVKMLSDRLSREHACE